MTGRVSVALSRSDCSERKGRAESKPTGRAAAKRWLDLTRICLAHVVALLALGLAPHPSTAQQWAVSGVPACQNGCPGDVPRVVSDGLGGAFVAWRDISNYSTNNVDVYLQHIDGSGIISPGWPADGLPVVALPGVPEFSDLAIDGYAGTLVR